MTLLPKENFKGDKKVLVHFLVPYERMFLKAALPLVPWKVNTAHLTLMTILWSLIVVASGWLAREDMRWLWLFSAAIVLQYMTDMLDGEVGRSRNNGLIKWGFYMDHFLDYIFLSSIVIGYSFLLPPSYFLWELLCLTFTAGFMVHAFMDFAITNNFKISCSQFGVSEARILLVLFNIVLMLTGPSLLITVFPFFVLISFIALSLLVYNAQKTYRHIDTIHQAQEDKMYQKI